MSNAIVLGLPIAGLVLVSITRVGSVQTSTRGEQPCLVGVGHYRLTYFEDDYDVRYVVARWVPSACVPCGG